MDYYTAQVKEKLPKTQFNSPTLLFLALHREILLLGVIGGM